MVRGTRVLSLVMAVALVLCTGVSWSQVPGGILDQKQSTGLSLLTVVAPPVAASPPAPPAANGLPPADEKFLCWTVWYANTGGSAWLLLTDAPDTEDGRIFSQEAIKSITSAPAGAKWTVRRFADAAGVKAESERVAAELAKAKAGGGTAAWLKSMAKKVFRLKR